MANLRFVFVAAFLQKVSCRWAISSQIPANKDMDQKVFCGRVMGKFVAAARTSSHNSAHFNYPDEQYAGAKL